jgi:menaquinone-specific isochorismate synthase
VSLPKLGEDDDSLSLEALVFLRQALMSPLPAGADLLSITLPAPTEAAEKFLRLVPRENGFLWRSPSGEQFAGGGAAGEVTVGGADRFDRLGRAVPEFFARVATCCFGGLAPPPVLVGGAAFAPGVPPIEPWEEFTVDAFVLPRWGYRRLRNAASITLTVRREELGTSERVARIIDEARTLTRAFEYESATSLIERIDLSKATVHHLLAADWTGYIDAIHAAIGSGDYQKIVAARRCVIQLQRSLEDTGFMARVFAAYPDCTHFAIRRDRSTFLGATPETLFRKRGLILETHALAGTTRINDDPSTESSRDVAALQGSQKDLDEHRLVVERICSELRPLTERLQYSNTPSTRQVRNLIHLQTPISGELRKDTSAFHLLAALHPTPAVGGFPAREAAEWIAQNEPLERGWYSGTVGWIDANGDGEIAVAIRCGVLTQERAYVFAGAGIVAASTAAAEYAETGGKMGPVLRALGVVF